MVNVNTKCGQYSVLAIWNRRHLFLAVSSNITIILMMSTKGSYITEGLWEIQCNVSLNSQFGSIMWWPIAMKDIVVKHRLWVCLSKFRSYLDFLSPLRYKLKCHELLSIWEDKTVVQTALCAQFHTPLGTDKRFFSFPW